MGGIVHTLVIYRKDVADWVPFSIERGGQEISMSMPAERVIKLLEKVIWLQWKPKTYDVTTYRNLYPKYSRSGVKATI